MLKLFNKNDQWFNMEDKQPTVNDDPVKISTFELCKLISVTIIIQIMLKILGAGLAQSYNERQ
jgi:hypothetical protein